MAKRKTNKSKFKRGESATALLDTKEAAAYLAISISALYHLVRSGELPYVRVGRSIRFNIKELDKYMKDRSSRIWKKKGKTVPAEFTANAAPTPVLIEEDDGLPAIALYDEEGKPRIGLTILSDGKPSLLILDKDGKTLCMLCLNDDEKACLCFNDPSGRPRAFLTVNPEGKTELVFLDKHGSSLGSLIANIGGLSMVHPSEESNSDESPQHPVFQLFDKEGFLTQETTLD